MARIQQLSSELANKIAAGEVVARPASVVKECMENSIDANSTAIVMDVEQGGTRLIRITDNGDGIVKDDLPLALSAHATSKISTAEDLFNIDSLGFRGEALASIAAVSRFSLASKPASQEQGWQVQKGEGSHALEITPAAQPEGTTVTVEDLFYNVPARRKFLSSARTELHHIMGVIKALALSHFYVGFTVQQQKKALVHWPAVVEGQEAKRIQQVLGASFLDQALNVDFHGEGLRLWGWLGTPEGHRSHKDCQYVFVNGRLVQDSVMTHGIRQAYGHDLPEGRYGAYVLFLTVPPSEVDVNVHPTKREVRFHHSRLVHDFIVTRLQSAFATVRQNRNEHKVEGDEDLWEIAPTDIKPEAVESAIVTAQKSLHTREETDAPYEIIYGSSAGKAAEPPPAHQPPEPPMSSTHEDTLATKAMDKKPLSDPFHLLGVYEGRYGLMKRGEHLYAVHMPRAVMQCYKMQYQAGLSIQPLLIPTALTFASEKVLAMESCYGQWRDYGLDCHGLSEDTVIVRGLPKLAINLEKAPSKAALEKCLEALMACSKNEAATIQIIGSLLSECVSFQRMLEQKDTLSEWMNEDGATIVVPVQLSALFE